MKDLLTNEELAALKKWPTPAIANAIELFNIKPRSEGFMLPEIQCQFPKLGTMIGYAVTAVITAQSPDGRKVPPPDYWAEIQKIPAPRVAVIHDIDNPVIGLLLGRGEREYSQGPGLRGDGYGRVREGHGRGGGGGVPFLLQLRQRIPRLCASRGYRDPGQGRAASWSNPAT